MMLNVSKSYRPKCVKASTLLFRALLSTIAGTHWAKVCFQRTSESFVVTGYELHHIFFYNLFELWKL